MRMADPLSLPLPLRWSAYEHEHIERTSEWFWALGIIAACTAFTALLFGNVLFGLLIIIAAGTLGLIASRPPEIHEFEIGERGIRVSDTLHSYDEIISFFVDTELEKPLLLVDTVKFMSPNLVIPLDGADADEVRSFLKERVREVPMIEPLSHKILEFFGL